MDRRVKQRPPRIYVSNELTHDYRASAASLAQMLALDRVTSESGAGRLLIVGDGELQHLPFAAVLVPSRSGYKREAKQSKPASFENGDNLVPLLVHYEIEQPQSMSVMAELRRDRIPAQTSTDDKTIAVIADPVFGTHDVRCCTRQRRQSIAKNTSGAEPSEFGVRALPFSKKDRSIAQEPALLTGGAALFVSDSLA